MTDETPTPIPDDTPLNEVVDAWDAEGYAGQFRVEPDAQILCLSCGAPSPAADHSANNVTRLEGPSDPADMEIVVPLECPNCGARGTLVLNYGPEASADEADVLRAFRRDHPSEGEDGSPLVGR